MDYNWREDIVDVIDNPYISSEAKDELLYQAAERIVEDNGLDYYDHDADSAISEEMSNIIGLWSFPTDSTLYDLLLEWYDGWDNMMAEIRDSFVYGDNIYFVTGTGYSLFDSDLLGGSGDGQTVARFDEFVRNHE